MRRWTKAAKLDIFDLDKVIIPCHQGMHWTLAVINIKEKRIEYYDSYHAEDEGLREALFKYVQDEYRSDWEKKRGGAELPDPDDWDVHWGNRDKATSAKCRKDSIPRQTNGHDCGVFMTSNAEAAGVVGRLFEIQEQQMVEMRQCMMWELLNKRLRVATPLIVQVALDSECTTCSVCPQLYHLFCLSTSSVCPSLLSLSSNRLLQTYSSNPLSRPAVCPQLSAPSCGRRRSHHFESQG